MSVQALSCAFALRGLTSSEKLVLLALSNYADQNMRCWPSQETIAFDTELSERTVWGSLRSLEEKRIIQRTERRRADGTRSTDIFTLHFALTIASDQPANSAKSTRKSCETNPQILPNQPAAIATLTTFEPPIEEPSSLSEHTRLNADAAREAGDALASLAVCPGIATIAPLRALLTGPTPCDWELDVLPAIASAAAWHRARAGPGSMKSWTTASRIAAENRDRRLAGPPKQNHERPDPHPDPRRTNYAGRLADIDAAMEAAVEPLAVRR